MKIPQRKFRRSVRPAKARKVVQLLAETNAAIGACDSWNPVPAWARWQAQINGITVWFSHKPQKDYSIVIAVGYPTNRYTPNTRHHQTDREFPWSVWGKTVRRLRP